MILSGYDRLVTKTARSLLNSHARSLGLFDQLLIEGRLGVLRAARSFDLDRFTYFFPHCKRFVWGSIWFAALEQFSAFELPANVIAKAVMIRSGLAALGADATPSEISRFADVPVSRVERLWAAANHTMSINGLEDPDQFADVPPDDSEGRNKAIAILSRLIPDLRKIELECVLSIYANGDDPDLVGKAYRITPEDVKEIARDVMARMRLKASGQLDLSIDAPSSLSSTVKAMQERAANSSRIMAKTISVIQLTLPGVAS